MTNFSASNTNGAWLALGVWADMEFAQQHLASMLGVSLHQLSDLGWTVEEGLCGDD